MKVRRKSWLVRQNELYFNMQTWGVGQCRVRGKPVRRQAHSDGDAGVTGIRNHQGKDCRPKRKGQRAKPSGVSSFRTREEKEPMETEEIVGEGVGTQGSFVAWGWGGKRERPGAMERWKPVRSEERLLDLGVRGPSAGNIYKGMSAEGRFLKARAQEYVANLYSIQQNF